MHVMKNLNEGEILCVNGEFYIFLDEAKKQIDLHIESEGKIQTWRGTKDDLRKAAKEKNSKGEFGLGRIGRNNGGVIFLEEGGKVKYTLTLETDSQVQLGINAPRNLNFVRDNVVTRK
jgi:hypothetical protein